MKKIKAVIFDMDGVLFDSETTCLECFRRAFQDVNVEFDENFYLTLLGTTRQETRAKFIESLGSEEIFNKMYKRFQELFFLDYYPNGKVKFKIGAIECMNYLRQNNIPFGLATSNSRKTADLAFSSQGYETIPFDYIITGENLTHSKPHPEVFLKTAKMMNIDITDCMVVEDSRNGILAAHNAKSISVLVPDIIKPDEEMTKAATYIKKDLLEVKKLIEELI